MAFENSRINQREGTHNRTTTRRIEGKMWLTRSGRCARLSPPISATLASFCVRMQLVFVAPRVRLWLILAFQLQLYTKTSSIGQQVILDSEAPARHSHWSLVRGTCLLTRSSWGRSGSISTPDEEFISPSREEFIVRLIILVSMLLYFFFHFFFLRFNFESLRIHRDAAWFDHLKNKQVGVKRRSMHIGGKLFREVFGKCSRG